VVLGSATPLHMRVGSTSSNPPFSAMSSLDLQPQLGRLSREFLLVVQFHVQLLNYLFPTIPCHVRSIRSSMALDDAVGRMGS
jgi:hypothetical protein